MIEGFHGNGNHVTVQDRHTRIPSLFEPCNHGIRSMTFSLTDLDRTLQTFLRANG